MGTGLYVGMTGASARSSQLEAVADNLANAQTPGFKGALPAFQTFLPDQDGSPMAHVATVAGGLDLREGPVVQTGNGLDVMPGPGLYMGVALPSGETAYTRNGKLIVDPAGVITSAGHPLLGSNGQPVKVPPNTRPEITHDGRVTVGGEQVGRLAMFRIDGQMRRAGNSAFLPELGATATEAAPLLRTGELESANTTALDAAVQLVGVQRHYENAIQAIQTYRKMDGTAAELGKVR